MFPSRASETSSKVSPHRERTAVLPVYCCQRLIATSTYFGSSSIARARRPVFSAAIRTVPLPQKGSRTRPPRFEQSLIASATIKTGFTVGSHGELIQASGSHRIHTFIIPSVRRMATILLEFKVVQVRGRTVLPHKTHFVLRAIKRTHSGVVLVPDAYVLELRIVGITRCEHFSHMAPIHADLVNRAIGRVLAKRSVHAREKGCELAFAHFPGCHSELTVLDAAQARHVAINLYVIGRVGKNELGLIVVHQQLVSRGIRGISADQSVLSEHPDIAQAADGGAIRLLGHQGFRLLAFIPDTLDDDIDFR